MLDLKIDCLQLEINNAAGHEHRIGAIAERAAAMLAEHIDIQYRDGRARLEGDGGGITARPINLDLNRTSDEHAARVVADAWLDALALRLTQ
jgi:hypothetical protein